MLPTLTKDTIDLPPGTQICYPGTLEEYEQMLERLSDRPVIRIRFREQQILLMTPVLEHSHQAGILSDLVKALLCHQDREWESLGIITLKKAGTPGVEPDACFYIENRQAILGKERLNLDIDPPPDLSIETDLTSFSDINDYVPIAVPEVWIYQSGELRIYRFEGDRYLEKTTSQIFPGIAIKEILPNYVQRAWEIGSSVALREFERELEQELEQGLSSQV